MFRSVELKAVARVLTAFLFVVLLVGSASAYTIVMRGGKRVEIPAQFVLTANTLTYEAGPGIQVTLEVAAIDVAATEKANHEPAGAFLRRISPQPGVQGMNTAPPLSARRTITNRDLEATVARRRQSEIAYEKRRQELGLPSIAESRRRAELESMVVQSDLEQSKQARDEAERYWRERAAALRTEMKEVDAKIAYLATRIDELSTTGPLVSGFTSFSAPFLISGSDFRVGFGNRGFGNPGFGRTFGRAGFHRPLTYSSPVPASPGAPRVGLPGGRIRGDIRVNSGRFGGFGAVGFPVTPFPIVSTSSLYGGPYQPYDNGYDRSVLISNYYELTTLREGLRARWRELEDEARRAGAPPGWLRP